MKLEFASNSDGFDLLIGDRILVSHRSDCPALVMAQGNPAIEMYRGNFRIEDTPTQRIAPGDFDLTDQHVTLLDGDKAVATLSIDGHRLNVATLLPGYDRLTLSLFADAEECVWGGGEQMSYVALNGRRFPIWTSEPGVGRDKSTELTRIMDEQGMAGGDYWNS
ncbi:MAG: alpha-glucosidase, partial [Alphaproteobacteria bacterium]